MGRTRSQRSQLPEPEAERIAISSEEEADNVEQSLVRDGSSSVPDGGYSALPEDQQDELVKRMVRYMICRNAKKKPVRRNLLTAHTFANMTNIRSKQRVFNGTFQQAQRKLRGTFGMEMVEICKLVKRTNPSQSQPRTSTISSSQGASASAKGYILVSVLPMEARVEDADAMALLGFLSVVAAMILLEPGCRIEEQDLHNALKRIGILVKEKHGHKQLNGGNVKDLLEKELPDQWYLEREREGNSVYYTLGPRLRAELEDEDLLEFINAVYKQGNEGSGMLDETGRKALQIRLDEAWGPDGPPEEE